MTITAIIPCYNAEPHLAEAIESALRQTRPVDEVLVVDDCSTDDSREVARKYPVTLLCTPSNSGHAMARNLGIEAARGDVIVWLDADDFFDPNHVEVVCGLLDAHPDAAVAYSRVRQFGEDDAVIGAMHCVGRPRNVLAECLRRTIVPAMSAATRTAALTAVGRYDPAIRIAPDYELWLRLSHRFAFVCTEEITSNYRRHTGQISAHPRRQLRSVYESRWRFLKRLEAEGDHVHVRQVRRGTLEAWEDDLRSAWRRRDVELTRFFLSLRGFVPGNSKLADALRWKTRMPRGVVGIWDFCRDARRATARRAMPRRGVQ